MDQSGWAALADPHRRQVLELLRDRPRSVADLVVAVGLTQPSTSKHLRVLREAGLVHVDVVGQRRIYSVAVAPLEALDTWLQAYRPLFP